LKGCAEKNATKEKMAGKMFLYNAGNVPRLLRPPLVEIEAICLGQSDFDKFLT
jgi:hypothetical protein